MIIWRTAEKVRSPDHSYVLNTHLCSFDVFGCHKLLNQWNEPKWHNKYYQTNSSTMYYCIAGKFGRELKLAVWWMDQPTAKLKSADNNLFKMDSADAMPLQCDHTHLSGCGLWSWAQLFLVIVLVYGLCRV